MPHIFSRKNNAELRILRLFKDGNPNATRALYDKYAGYLTAVCSRYVANDSDVEDILQDSFLTFISGIGAFEYRGEGSLKAWMSRVVVNLSLKHLRNSKRIVFSDIGDIDRPEEPDTESIPPDVIHQMIVSLPEGYRTVFNLYVLEGWSHREISQMLGITESTSASQLHRAKAMLATMIRNYNGELR